MRDEEKQRGIEVGSRVWLYLYIQQMKAKYTMQGDGATKRNGRIHQGRLPREIN